MSAVCPYCRTPIDEAENPAVVCNGCGTPHHADCYEENGGCTVFGCSAAPAPEPKLSIAAPDLNAAPVAAVATAAMNASVAPPPPLPGFDAAAASTDIQWPPHGGTGYVLFGAQPIATPQVAPALAYDFDLTPDEDAKGRMTFILLGVLLGAFGAHNFYAGYRNKALAQLLITVLTLGFAGPMSWMWAVVDVCTITEDSTGVKFKN